jgi:hypothetical protein
MEFVGLASAHNSLVSTSSRSSPGEIHGSKMYVAPNGTPLHARAPRASRGVPPRAGPVHIEFFPIMVFYQNSPVSRPFELSFEQR